MKLNNIKFNPALNAAAGKYAEITGMPVIGQIMASAGNGVQGIQGIQGVQGIQGIQGVQGIQGIQG